MFLSSEQSLTAVLTGEPKSQPGSGLLPTFMVATHGAGDPRTTHGEIGHVAGTIAAAPPGDSISMVDLINIHNPDFVGAGLVLSLVEGAVSRTLWSGTLDAGGTLCHVPAVGFTVVKGQKGAMK
jgi:hypothetical protein